MLKLKAEVLPREFFDFALHTFWLNASLPGIVECCEEGGAKSWGTSRFFTSNTNIERLHYAQHQNPCPTRMRMLRMKALQVSNANEEKWPKRPKHNENAKQRRTEIIKKFGVREPAKR